MSSGFVCLMGMGIVFIGLICIVLICNITSFLVTRFEKTEQKNVVANNAAVSVPSTTLPIEEKRAILAGVCAVIAEELGTEASNIRVLSFKKAL